MQIKKFEIIGIWWLLIILSLPLLVSCGAYDFDDLESFTNTRKMSVAHIEAMPVFSKNPQYAEYDAKNQRDPFSAIAIKPNVDEPQTDSYKNTLANRSGDRERLEKYTLSSIRMVGMLEKRGLIWALVRIPDTSILSVRKGNYMGKHQGLVVAINKDKILLEERIIDDLGRWVKRKNEITLVQ